MVNDDLILFGDGRDAYDLTMARYVADSIMHHCMLHEVEEVCGVLIRNNRKIIDLVWVPNRAANPRHEFEIHAADVAHLRTETILGPFHSHPTGKKPLVSYWDVFRVPLGDTGLMYHPRTATLVRYSRRGWINQYHLPTLLWGGVVERSTE